MPVVGDRARQEIETLGLVAHGAGVGADVATVDVDLPRIAMYTTWSNTEKVGWVRLAFDRWEIPFDLIHKDHVKQGEPAREVRRDRDAAPGQQRQVHRLRAAEAVEAAALQEERQVQVVRLVHGDRRRARRHGAGGRGRVPEVRGRRAACWSRSASPATFPAEFGIAKGVDAQNAQPGFYAPGPYVQSEILIPTHPVMFGYDAEDAAGALCRRAAAAGRSAGRSSRQFAGIVAGRPQVIARFTGGDAGVLSGVMRGADQIRNRPMVVDAPSGKGRVLLFANNPIYRWQTFGEHEMVFNALLFWNDFPAAAPETKPAPSAQQ